MFEDFCKENGRVCDLKTVTEEDIASILEDFYVGVRRQDKSEYKRASLINARGAIQRQLNVLDRGMDIKRGKFARADKMLDAVLVDKKQCGREDRVVHKNSISDNDWSLIKTYFSDVSTTLDTKKLTQYVWFETSLHFCLRGSEAQSQLKTSDLVFSTIAGEDAITLNADFMSKESQWKNDYLHFFCDFAFLLNLLNFFLKRGFLYRCFTAFQVFYSFTGLLYRYVQQIKTLPHGCAVRACIGRYCPRRSQ